MQKLHIGRNETVPNREIIGIFDIEKATEAKVSRDFLKRMQGELKVVNLCPDLPRAFVLCDNAYTDRVYMTSLSARALRGRCGE